MKAWVVIFSLIVVGFIGWQLWFALLIGVKEPSYEVLQKKNGYEVRRYTPYITAETRAAGTKEKAANEGFKVLADYIFGDNTQNIKMPMTAPVFVETTKDENKKNVSFVMPFDYTIKTLPKPNNKEIKIKEKKGKVFAAYRFTWHPTEKRVAHKKELFAALLERDGIKTLSPIMLARYNPPFIMPFLMRNELLVEIKKPRK